MDRLKIAAETNTMFGGPYVETGQLGEKDRDGLIERTRQNAARSQQKKGPVGNDWPFD